MNNIHPIHQPALLSIWVFDNHKRLGTKTQTKTAWRRIFERERRIISGRGGSPIFTEEEFRSSCPSSFNAKYALIMEDGTAPFIEDKLLKPKDHSVLVISHMPRPFHPQGRPRLTFYEIAHCKNRHQIDQQVDALRSRIKYLYALEIQKRKYKRQLTLI